MRVLLLLCLVDPFSAEPDGWVTREGSTKEYWFSRAQGECADVGSLQDSSLLHFFSSLTHDPISLSDVPRKPRAMSPHNRVVSPSLLSLLQCCVAAVVAGESKTKTWCKAGKKCQALNAHLANIGSAEENTWIAEQITANAWIGFNKDTFLSNDWDWSDGNNHWYTNWNVGEPNKRFDNCVELMPYSGKWNNDDCGCGITKGAAHFVCERAAPVTTTATTVTVTVNMVKVTATTATTSTTTTTSAPSSSTTTIPSSTSIRKRATPEGLSILPTIPATTLATNPSTVATTQDYAPATTHQEHPDSIPTTPMRMALHVQTRALPTLLLQARAAATSAISPTLPPLLAGWLEVLLVLRFLLSSFFGAGSGKTKAATEEEVEEER